MASAAPGPTVTVLSSSVFAPFQLDYRQGLYVADGGTQKISRLDGGTLTPVATSPAGAAGLAVGPDGGIAYTSTNQDHSKTQLIIKGAHPLVKADLSGFEAARNPDKRTLYGVDHPSQCVKNALVPLGGANYKGGVDSHPYAVASLDDGSWLVADAGGNDVVRVDRAGNVTLIGVLPRQPAVITQDFADSFGLPSCVVGVTYNFEAVPTDVEVAADGTIYVTTSAGRPRGTRPGRPRKRVHDGQVDGCQHAARHRVRGGDQRGSRRLRHGVRR